MLVLQKDVMCTRSQNLPDSDAWQQSRRVTPTRDTYPEKLSRARRNMASVSSALESSSWLGQ